MKTITNVLNTKINGTVTNVQNGQHGPAAMIGLPSFLSSKKKNEPTLRAQQQKYLWKSSIVKVRQGLLFVTGSVAASSSCRRRSCSRSHLTDTAYLRRQKWRLGLSINRQVNDRALYQASKNSYIFFTFGLASALFEVVGCDWLSLLSFPPLWGISLVQLFSVLVFGCASVAASVVVMLPNLL